MKLGFYSKIPQEFYEQNLGRSKQYSIHGIILINIASLLFSISDYQIAANTPIYVELLATRLSFLLISLVIISKFRSNISFKIYSWLIVFWVTCLSLLNILIQQRMASDYLINFGVEVAMLIAIFVLLKNTLSMQFLASMIFISMTVYLNMTHKEFTSNLMLVMCLSFASFEVLGLIASNYIDRTNAELMQKVEEERKLKEALDKNINSMKRLKGLIPICSTCHKIKNDEGDWAQLEHYLQEHTDATFSHSICKDCTLDTLKKLT